MNLKKGIKRFSLLILVLLTTLAGSQTVQIDSIKKTTLLDSKATIAQGNISKQRDSLINIVKSYQKLTDSLRKESNNYKTEADTLKKAYFNLKYAIREKKIQLESKDKELMYSEKLFKADLKALRRKRLGLGVSVGYGFTSQGQNAFFGLSINYTFIRF